MLNPPPTPHPPREKKNEYEHSFVFVFVHQQRRSADVGGLCRSETSALNSASGREIVDSWVLGRRGEGGLFGHSRGI